MSCSQYFSHISTCSFWRIHMIGVYMIYWFVTCVCIQRDVCSYKFVCLSFLGGWNSCIFGVLISRSFTHMVPGSNNESTPCVHASLCWCSLKAFLTSKSLSSPPNMMAFTHNRGWEQVMFFGHPPLEGSTWRTHALRILEHVDWGTQQFWHFTCVMPML